MRAQLRGGGSAFAPTVTHIFFKFIFACAAAGGAFAPTLLQQQRAREEAALKAVLQQSLSPALQV